MLNFRLYIHQLLLMKLFRLPIILCALAIISLGGTTVAQSISSKTTLNIVIKGVPQVEQVRISGQYVVSPQGYVFLPLLDNGIKASGLSSSALARKIEAAYREAEMYQSPRINVISAKDNAESNIDAQTVTIGGYVKSPGPKPYMRNMTLYQAVSAAGGANAFGSIRRVELFRGGKRSVYDLRKTEDMGIKIFPGDSINVPQKTAFGG